MPSIQRAIWRKTWKAPDLGIVDEPMIVSMMKYRADEDRSPSNEVDHNLVSSHVVGTKLQAAIIDLDFPHHYVQTTSPGHGHLYLDVPVAKWRWIALMTGLYLGGAVERGYFLWSIRRGANYARRPGVIKTEDVERIHYTYGLLFKLRKGKNEK